MAKKLPSPSDDLSKKLDVLIALTLKNISGDKEFGETRKRKQGVGEQARYLASFGLGAEEISRIVGAPLSSVRTLLTPGRRK